MRLKNPGTLSNDLLAAKTLVYDACGFPLTNLCTDVESPGYAAASFRLNGLKIIYRASKITPAKTGQFVTVWKRDEKGITAPFDLSDDLDLIIIASRSGDRFGQFIFSKAVLFARGILAGNGKNGKRGIRVYPPWDKTTSKQAQKTQQWQLAYL